MPSRRKTPSVISVSVVVMIVMVLWACSRYEVVDMGIAAATGNVGALGRMATRKAVRYAVNPEALGRDFKKLVDTIKSIWGQDEVEIPEPKRYVKYSHNYLSRALIDFDRGKIVVETLSAQKDAQKPNERLKNAIVATLLTPYDPRAVDLFSDSKIALGPTPFLYNEVVDQDQKPIRWEWRAGRFADHLIKTGLKKRALSGKGPKKTVYYVTFDMVADHLKIRARKYKNLIERHASRFKISPNLVYAIIETESDFNPYAVSKAPAFGLMQVVPSTAGQDVHRFLGRTGKPTSGFLFNADNNIKYGTAYLHLLKENYLKGIANPVSKEYCVIAAYNTGAGNVLKTFSTNREQAVVNINQLKPLQVYKKLVNKLTYDEARRYLVKVVKAKKHFVKM